jgi:hypothetical protein
MLKTSWFCEDASPWEFVPVGKHLPVDAVQHLRSLESLSNPLRELQYRSVFRFLFRALGYN